MLASRDWAAQEDHTVVPADWPHQIQLWLVFWSRQASVPEDQGWLLGWHCGCGHWVLYCQHSPAVWHWKWRSDCANIWLDILSGHQLPQSVDHQAIPSLPLCGRNHHNASAGIRRQHIRRATSPATELATQGSDATSHQTKRTWRETTVVLVQWDPPLHCWTLSRNHDTTSDSC